MFFAQLWLIFREASPVLPLLKHSCAPTVMFLKRWHQSKVETIFLQNIRQCLKYQYCLLEKNCLAISVMNFLTSIRLANVQEMVHVCCMYQFESICCPFSTSPLWAIICLWSGKTCFLTLVYWSLHVPPNDKNRLWLSQNSILRNMRNSD